MELYITHRLPAKASCVSQIRTARAVTEELGQGAATRSGVQAWAQIPEKHSERDVHKVVQRQGTRLEVPMICLSLLGERVPYIDPRAWAEFIIGRGLSSMFAGLSPDQNHLSPIMWRSFWNQFYKLNPHHPVFEESDFNENDWGYTIGLYIHGDEGRTLKKSGLMVTALQSCLGKGFDNKRLKRDAFGDFKPQVNFTEHTFTNRFVNFVMPKTLYATKPDIYHEALAELSKSLRSLFDSGITDPVTKQHYRFVVLGCKGDLPYLAKAGFLNRTFNTGTKRGDSNKEHGVCHLCMAGFTEYPAEEITTSTPAWLSSIGMRLPWTKTPPFIQYLPYDVQNPGSFFLVDIWHCVHLGFGRSWIASTLNYMLDVLPHSNLDLKWEFLTQHYFTWCRRNKSQSHIGKITPYLMSFDDKTGKQGRWHKGALTTNFCKWIVTLFDDVPSDTAGILQRCKHATQKLNAMFSCFYQAGFFLNKAEGLYCFGCGMEFLSTYAYVARAMFDGGRPSLWPLYPKLHFMHHMLLQLKEQTQQHGFSQNPVSTACQMDEDVIGKVSRLSRRVSIRTTMQRTMDRYVIAAYDAWRTAGLIDG